MSRDMPCITIWHRVAVRVMAVAMVTVAEEDKVKAAAAGRRTVQMKNKSR